MRKKENDFLDSTCFRALSDIIPESAQKIRFSSLRFFFPRLSLSLSLFIQRPADYYASYNFSQKASIIVIVRKFTVDRVVVRGATTCESSQGEETGRET